MSRLDSSVGLGAEEEGPLSTRGYKRRPGIEEEEEEDPIVATLPSRGACVCLGLEGKGSGPCTLHAKSLLS